MENKFKISVVLLLLGLISCSAPAPMKEMEESAAVTEDYAVKEEMTEAPEEEYETESMEQSVESQLVLTEDKLGEVFLAEFSKGDVSNMLKTYFPNLELNKEIGHHDGPDFDLYNLKKDSDEQFSVLMDFEDSKILWMIMSKNPSFTDEYGVKTEMSVEELMSKRSCVQFYADLHANVYAACENSAIKYRLKGDFKSNPDGSFADENFDMTLDQVREMTVESIIWEK